MVSRASVLRGVCDYLSRFSQEDADVQLQKMEAEIKSDLQKRRERRDREAAKNFIIEHYRGWFGIDLEDQDWFIGWVDALNERGHQMFAVVCQRCDGVGKLPLFLRQDLSTVCNGCRGEGITYGPRYCRDKNCPGTHLIHGSIPLGMEVKAK